MQPESVPAGNSLQLTQAKIRGFRGRAESLLKHRNCATGRRDTGHDIAGQGDEDPVKALNASTRIWIRCTSPIGNVFFDLVLSPV